jgi:hypothetical protein
LTGNKKIYRIIMEDNGVWEDRAKYFMEIIRA